MSFGFHPQIGPPFRRIQIGDRAAAAQTVAGEQLIVARAFLVAVVEIVVARHAELPGSGDDRLHEFLLFADVGA